MRTYDVDDLFITNFTFRILSEPALVKREDSIYHFSLEKKTYNEAEDYCQSIGGHLASVHSKQENDFIKRETIAR